MCKLNDANRHIEESARRLCDVSKELESVFPKVITSQGGSSYLVFEHRQDAMKFLTDFGVSYGAASDAVFSEAGEFEHGIRIRD